MRMDGRVWENVIKQERALLRKKKVAIFLLVFFFYLGLVAVDGACTEMTRHSGVLTLQSKRIDEERLLISFLGREATVNTSWILTEISRVRDSASEAVSVLTKMAVDWGDDKQPQDKQPQGGQPRNREIPFPSKTL